MKILQKIIVGLLLLGLIYWCVHPMLCTSSIPAGVLDEPLAQEQEEVVALMDHELQEEPVVIQFLHDEINHSSQTSGQDGQMVQFVEKIQEPIILPIDSFITMSIQHGSQLDTNIQSYFDHLIGENIDGLLDLIGQSSNNLLSTDSCRTCAIDAILKKVSKHKILSNDEIVSLQHVVANLYKFVNTLQDLNQKTILTAEQYWALKNLNTSQVSMNQLALQRRQAATIAALQSLKNIDMVQRQG